ncbi:MAG: Peptidyl-prolyl cis-trans isomerase B [Chaenotheca gracillima]|nr:MAG: Peptidyl-prolyl cis-trans isomerase B [Chaenotheca gracillima]
MAERESSHVSHGSGDAEGHDPPSSAGPRRPSYGYDNGNMNYSSSEDGRSPMDENEPQHDSDGSLSDAGWNEVEADDMSRDVSQHRGGPRGNDADENEQTFDSSSDGGWNDPMEVDDRQSPASHSRGTPQTKRQDPRTSLQHVLGQSSPGAMSERNDDAANSEMATPSKPRTWGGDGTRDTTEDEGDGSVLDHRHMTPSQGNRSTPQGTSAKADENGTTSSVYGGNKIKHLKREDGVPLWRKDIQFDFLRAVFEDKREVFTKFKDGTTGHTFADIYIDAMAESKKTSKILKDKLHSDRLAAENMAMVCLLVNVGRMNTTLNFFPEMRAALRTYHAIPVLQVHEDSNAYKQLQDAPRLKSILKGACEDKQEPYTLDAIKDAKIPRTNPVNLIFVLAQYAPKVTDIHFTKQLEFFHLVTRTTLSSASRANAFLWLMWWYLESDFTAESAQRNPFGAGQEPEVDGVPQKLPPFEYLTEEEEKKENIDTEQEITYGQIKQAERKRINESEAAAKRANNTDDSAFAVAKRGKKSVHPLLPSDEGGDDSARDTVSPHPTAPPSRSLARSRPRKSGLNSIQLEEERLLSSSPAARADAETGGRTSSKRRGRGARQKEEPSGTQRIILRTKLNQMADSSSLNQSAGGGHHLLLQPDGTHQRSRRPLTAHQIAVEQNRQARVEHKLDRRLQAIHGKRKRARDRDGAIWRAWKRHEAMEDPFENSEDEDWAAFVHGVRAQYAQTKPNVTLVGANGQPVRDRARFGGIMGSDEEDDFGEEVGTYAAALRRTARRLDRWDLLPRDQGGVMSTLTKKRSPKESEPDGNQLDEGESMIREKGEATGRGARAARRGSRANAAAAAAAAAVSFRDDDDGNSAPGSPTAEADAGYDDTDEELDEIDRDLLRHMGMDQEDTLE